VISFSLESNLEMAEGAAAKRSDRELNKPDIRHKKRPGFSDHLRKFPGGIDLERNPKGSRDVDL
jgi:hypothetical protein